MVAVGGGVGWSKTTRAEASISAGSKTAAPSSTMEREANMVFGYCSSEMATTPRDLRASAMAMLPCAAESAAEAARGRDNERRGVPASGRP